MKKLVSVFVILSLIVSLGVSVSAASSPQFEMPASVNFSENVLPRSILQMTADFSTPLPTGEEVTATVRFSYNDSNNDIAGIQSIKYSCPSNNVSGLKTVATKMNGSYATITFGYTYIPTGLYKTDFVHVYVY